MRIRASLPSYKQIEVEMSPTKTVRDLKMKVCKELEIQPGLTNLLTGGRALKDNTRVAKIKSPVTVDYLWARHLLLWGQKGQTRIRNSSVVLAGAGAIGNEVAKNLAMLGIGTMLIVDRDNVEMSNISRMMFFEPENLGKNKAEALARNVHRKYPFVEAIAFKGDLEAVPLKFYLDSDVIVCGLDNVVSRIYLAQISRRYSIPLVDGGITGLNARVHVYLPPNDACPVCMFPPNQYSTIVGLRNPCDAPLEQEAVPSLSTSISLVSSIMAQETIKLILGIEEYRTKAKWADSSGQPLRSVLFIDLKNNRYTPMELKRGEKCIVCGKDGTARETSRRSSMPIETLHQSGGKLETTVRKQTKVGSGMLKVLAETAHGTTPLDHHSNLKKAVSRGDYLRILVERKNGEYSESILRLT